MKAPSQLKLIQGLLVESRTMVRAFSVGMIWERQIVL